MKNIFFALTQLFTFGLMAQNQPPAIQHLQSTWDHSLKYFVSYHLADTENDPVDISLFMSIDSGKTYNRVTTATGDIGYPVLPGMGKWIELPSAAPAQWEQVFFKLVADDRQPVDIQAIVDQVDSNRLKSTLAYIPGDRNHFSNPSNKFITRDSISAIFSSLGLIDKSQVFSSGSNFSATNVIGRKNGVFNDNRIYIVDAHYDGVMGSPAADDNGSGIVAMLEAARILSKYNFKNTIEFIGFDLEEFGLKGSDYYIDTIESSDTIAGVINFEMVGYYSEKVNSQEIPPGFEILFPAAIAQVEADSNRGNFIANVANTASGQLRKAFDSAAVKYVPALKIISLEVPGLGAIAPDLRRSDHANFWDANIPALMITNTAEYRNNNYHTVNDVMDSLNFTFMSLVTKATIATLAELAGITHSTSAVTPLLHQVNIKDKTKEIFKIYPNPVKDKLSLSFDSINSDDYFVEVVSITGNKIFTSHIKKGSQNITIDTQSFPSGIYFITVSNGKLSQVSKITVENN